MTRRLWILALVVVVALAGTAGWLFMRTEGKPLEDIVLSEVIHSIFYTPQYVALHKNFFVEEGLNVRLDVAQGADKGAAALLSGSAQFALFGAEQAVYATKQGASNPIVAFAILTQRDGSFLVGRQEEPEFDWAKVGGKTIIGGRKGGVPQMVLEWILKQNEVTPFEDVDVIQNIALNATAQAFKEGTGDYVQLWEPGPTLLEQANAGKIVASLGASSGKLPYTVFHATGKYIKENPKTVQKFTNAIYRAQLWVQANSAQEIAQTIAPSFPDTDLELIAQVVQRYKDLDIWASDPILEEELLDHLQDVMIEAGELDGKVNYDDIVNTTFAEKAVKTVK